MDNIFDRLIRLNIRLEGALRVAADRHSPEAIAEATATFDAMRPLFEQLPALADAPAEDDAELTAVKCDEALNGEDEPGDEPDRQAVPDEPVVESDDDAVAEAHTETVDAAPASSAPVLRTAADLRKMFTLNDTFLFRRELFGGDNAEMNDTLELLASMRSLSEAEEYVYDDLQWNPDDDTVRDFMGIIDSFFNRR